MTVLLREWRIFYLRWALAEMPALHPDVPANIVRLRQLLDQRHADTRTNIIRAAWRWL